LLLSVQPDCARSTALVLDGAGVGPLPSKQVAVVPKPTRSITPVQLPVVNGVVLLTGEVPDQGVWAGVGNLAKTTEKVRVVQNELVVAPLTDIGNRTNDTYITSKVKARLIESKQLDAKDVVVVTERGVVYLMGLVSPSQGDAAAQVAASTSDVVRVVKLFEYRT